MKKLNIKTPMMEVVCNFCKADGEINLFSDIKSEWLTLADGTYHCPECKPHPLQMALKESLDSAIYYLSHIDAGEKERIADWMRCNLDDSTSEIKKLRDVIYSASYSGMMNQ